MGFPEFDIATVVQGDLEILHYFQGENNLSVDRKKAVQRRIIDNMRHRNKSIIPHVYSHDDWCFARRALNITPATWGYIWDVSDKMHRTICGGNFYDDMDTDGWENADPRLVVPGQKILVVGLDIVEGWVDEAYGEFEALEQLQMEKLSRGESLESVVWE